MLRALAKSLRSFAPVVEGQQWRSTQQFRSFGSATHDDDDHHEHGYAKTPTVFDNLIELNVLDLTGRRHTVRGMVGQTLSQALIEANFPATYFFPNMGFYTQHIVDAHVFIPKDYHSKVPCPATDSPEGDAIRRMFREIVQDYQKDTSFFASYITLTPELNNMTLGFGPIKPWVLHTHWDFNGVHDSAETQFSRPAVDIFG